MKPWSGPKPICARRLEEEGRSEDGGLHPARGWHRGAGGGEIRRPQPEPDHQLPVQLRSDAGVAGQHGALSALCGGAHRRHRPQGGDLEAEAMRNAAVQRAPGVGPGAGAAQVRCGDRRGGGGVAAQSSLQLFV
jgi:hypothetical protein